MPWMMRWAGGFPSSSSEARGRARRRRRRPRVRRPLPRRHRRDGRPRARRRCVDAVAAQAGARDHDDAADRGRRLGRRGADAPLRPAALAVHAHRHRRQPRGAAARPRSSPAARRSWSLATATTARSTRRSPSRRRTARPSSREGNVGPPVDPALTTTRDRVQRRRRAGARRSRDGDVACVLAEPAMTNMGIVLPDARLPRGAARADARARHAADHRRDAHVLGRAGRLHRGVGPRARPAHDRQGDRRRRPVRRARALRATSPSGCSPRPRPTSRTPAASAARWPATRCRWPRCGRRSAQVLTDDAFDAHDPARRRASPTACAASIAAHELPWNVTQLGCRAEYRFRPTPPRNGTQAHAAADAELERFLHLHALNRGVLLTPFHNMALMSPATTEADVDRHRGLVSERCSARLGCLTVFAGNRPCQMAAVAVVVELMRPCCSPSRRGRRGSAALPVRALHRASMAEEAGADDHAVGAVLARPRS